MRRAPLALAAVAALVAGCGGGGSSSQDQIKKVLSTYYGAFAEGDSATACDQLAKDTVQNLEKQAKGRSCTDVLNTALQQPDYASVAQKLKKAKITKITVLNDKATAQIDVPGLRGRAARAPVALKKEGDSWKIASAIR
ncbi:MAG TPA: nuclear transport factor 2 family protein [Thermoleophilaceae bacterium]